MPAEVFVLAILFVPAIVLMVLRASGSVVFLSLCLGSVLVSFVGDSAESFGNLLSANNTINHSMLPLILLVIPVVFSTIFMIRSVRGKLRLLLNILPSLAVGFVGLLLVAPLLPSGLHDSVVQTQAWRSVDSAAQLIVVVSTIISIFFLWLQRSKRKPSEESGKKHKH